MVFNEAVIQMGSERKLLTTALLSCCLMVSACDSGDPAANVRSASISSTELSLPLPDRIRSISALDPNNIEATAIVNGVQISLNPDGSGAYRGSIQVPARATFGVQIEFSERFANQKLVLATRSQQVTTGTTNQQLTVSRASYDFDSHDDDGDSASNIVEREEDTNPLDAAETPGLVNIPLIARQPQLLAGSSFSSYLFEASVGQDTKVLTASGNDFRGSFNVVNSAPVTASVQMIETVTGQRFAVATQSRQLNTITDQQTIIFEAGDYAIPDRDNDGQSDVAELIAGTDITNPDNSSATLTTLFGIPALIVNAENSYAEYRVDGQLVSLNRNENSFSATSSINAGTAVVLDVSILDNYEGQPYQLATARKTVSINNANPSVTFNEADFSFAIDTDADGTANYLERQQGTDPFNAPDVISVSCTAQTLPVTTGAPGDTVTIEDIASYINCGSDPYALDAAASGFNWNENSNNIAWTIPADADSGTTFGYVLNITDPSVSEVYTTAQVQTRVETVACTPITEQFQFGASKDLFFQGGTIFNNEELRVNASARRSLLGFTVPAQAGELTGAALVLSVGDDSGNGNIGVYQDDSYQWEETDVDLELPDLSNLVGSRDGLWQSGMSYTIGLTSLFVNGEEISLFLRQDSAGNDVAFTSRETSTPPVLVLEFTQCL